MISPNRPWSPLAAALGLAALLGAATPCPAYVAPFAVRNGSLIETAGGRPFFPRGFNYTRLAPWHATLNPGHYDSSAAEAMFARLSGGGFNVVRFWVGLEAGAQGAGPYSDAMLANLVDFLRRGRRHGVYGLPTFEYLPQAHRYAALAAPDPEGVKGVNSIYLNPGSIRVFRAFLADLLGALRARDPAVLEAIFAIDPQNECHYDLEGVFARESGSFLAPNGTAYPLPEGRRRLAEESARHWFDALADAVQAVAPGMLMEANVFTFAAVGRAGADDFRTALPDARMPFNLAALAGSGASILDLHVYAADTAALRRDTASIGMGALRDEARRSGKPLLIGEFGTFKRAFPALEGAVAWQTGLVRALYGMGFRGFLGWTYDTWEQPDIWNARDGDGALFAALAAEFDRLLGPSGLGYGNPGRPRAFRRSPEGTRFPRDVTGRWIRARSRPSVQ